LAEFQAEIGAIEAETADANRAETPPPDQQRFQDDDGTSYAWDSNLRRFVPAGDELPSASYDPADMVYEAEDEKIPAMPSVLPVTMPYDWFPLQQDPACVCLRRCLAVPHICNTSYTCLLLAYKISCGAWHVKAVNAANVLHAHIPVQQIVMLATAEALTHVSA